VSDPLFFAHIPCLRVLIPLFLPTHFYNAKNTVVNTTSFKTRSVRKEDVTREWFVIDAEGQTLGRMCTTIATYLRGKHKPEYTPHVDTGDNIIVVNAEKIKLTGDKWNKKEYVTFSGYPGGQKKTTAKELMDKKPTALVENAVRGMLPKNRLGRAMFGKMFVYAGPDHPHKAQKPKELSL
jgi:large subunit ribosomal protein L13